MALRGPYLSLFAKSSQANPPPQGVTRHDLWAGGDERKLDCRQWKEEVGVTRAIPVVLGRRLYIFICVAMTSFSSWPQALVCLLALAFRRQLQSPL